MHGTELVLPELTFSPAFHVQRSAAVGAILVSEPA